MIQPITGVNVLNYSFKENKCFAFLSYIQLLKAPRRHSCGPELAVGPGYPGCMSSGMSHARQSRSWLLYRPYIPDALGSIRTLGLVLLGVSADA